MERNDCVERRLMTRGDGYKELDINALFSVLDAVKYVVFVRDINDTTRKTNVDFSYVRMQAVIKPYVNRDGSLGAWHAEAVVSSCAADDMFEYARKVFTDIPAAIKAFNTRDRTDLEEALA